MSDPIVVVNRGPIVTLTATRPSSILVQQVPGVGPPGSSGSSVTDLNVVAGDAVGGHRVVVPTATGWVHADRDVAAHAHGALGLSLGAATSGATVVVRTAGEIVEPSWSWSVGLPVFVGDAGVPTQVAPASGWCRVVGVATSATSLVVCPQSPIVLT